MCVFVDKTKKIWNSLITLSCSHWRFFLLKDRKRNFIACHAPTSRPIRPPPVFPFIQLCFRSCTPTASIKAIFCFVLSLQMEIRINIKLPFLFSNVDKKDKTKLQHTVYYSETIYCNIYCKGKLHNPSPIFRSGKKKMSFKIQMSAELRD